MALEGAPSKLCLGGGVHPSQRGPTIRNYASHVPWGLKRFHESRQLHFLTCSCYRRRANLLSERSRWYFECALERVRQSYGMCVYGYVVMPEHVHVLVSEPERETLARAMQSLNQSVARTLALRAKDAFWQARYYDFNVWSEKKFVEKLRYIHRNPVAAGIGQAARRLALEQFPTLSDGRRGDGGDRIAVDGAAAGEDGNLSDSSSASRRKPPPKRSLDGAPYRVRLEGGGPNVPASQSHPSQPLRQFS